MDLENIYIMKYYYMVYAFLFTKLSKLKIFLRFFCHLINSKIWIKKIGIEIYIEIM